MQFPRLAGWPTEYPENDPTRALYLFYEDLVELKDNEHLAISHAWLSKFAHNALDLQDVLNHSSSYGELALDLHKIQNWILNAKEKGISLSDALSDAKRHHFKEVKELKTFMHEFIGHDKAAYNHLMKECAIYLKKKSYLG